MKTRDVTILLALLAMLAGLSVVLLRSDPPPAPTPEPAVASPQAPQAQPEQPAETAEAVAVDDGLPIEAATTRARPQFDTSGWTEGVIEGSITLAASVVPRLEGVLVTVTEAINVIEGTHPQPRPWTVTKSLPIGRSTPRFRFEHVPFSEYGYRVAVFAEGCNGSESHVRIDCGHPYVSEDELRLSITPGVSFTVRLQDQLRNPLPDLEVALIPIGEPLGRGVRPAQKTDSFGSTRFDDVIQGKWKIHVGPALAPIRDPLPVDVAPIGHAQMQVVEVPLGQPFVVRVVGPYAGLQDAQVTLTATDTVEFRQYKEKTAYSGEARFPHLAAGTYQVDVHAQGYGRSARKVVIKADQPPATLEIRLAPQ